MFTGTNLEEALKALGEVLADRHEDYDIVVVGGGALLILGLIDRPTEDLDVLARVEGEDLTSARPLPEPLREAVRQVAYSHDLAPDWLNAGPASLMEHALPEGFSSRLEIRTYGSLTIRFASRRDQVAFKLDAAADRWPDRSKHLKDLQHLSPDGAEIIAARDWCRRHRPPHRMRALDEVITVLTLGEGDG
jgi:hypothetical protein